MADAEHPLNLELREREWQRERAAEEERRLQAEADASALATHHALMAEAVEKVGASDASLPFPSLPG